MYWEMFHHHIVAGKVEQALDLYHENTRRLRAAPGFISRTVLTSQNDPLKITTVNIWQDEQAAKSWSSSPTFVHDAYGTTVDIPQDSDYYKKYGQGPSIQSSHPEVERWDVMPEP